tara:strand:+ start:403 stop:516 length:114 start_codon:yes stop_codon:yes gene_type:complete
MGPKKIFLASKHKMPTPIIKNRWSNPKIGCPMPDIRP